MAQSGVAWMGARGLGTFSFGFCSLLQLLEATLWGRPTAFKTPPGPAAPLAQGTARVWKSGPDPAGFLG